MIEPFEEYRVRLIETTLAKLAKENDPVMHIHVTHDLALMAFKRILLQRPIGRSDREPYQGGICTAIGLDGLWLLYNSNQESKLSLSD
jgi:hypothetical protein